MGIGVLLAEISSDIAELNFIGIKQNIITPLDTNQ